MTRIEMMIEAGKQAAPLVLAVLVGTLALAVLMYYGWQLMVDTIEVHRKAKIRAPEARADRVRTPRRRGGDHRRPAFRLRRDDGSRACLQRPRPQGQLTHTAASTDLPLPRRIAARA